MRQTLEGGCLCGAIRFRVEADPDTVLSGYCHCRMCQKNAGAPVVAWFVVPDDAFALTRGQLTRRRSSPKAERGFCAACGSYIAFFDGSGTTSLNTASLDEPARVPPRMHIWYESRVAWLEIADGLPRYDREPPP